MGTCSSSKQQAAPPTNVLSSQASQAEDDARRAYRSASRISLAMDGQPILGKRRATTLQLDMSQTQAGTKTTGTNSIAVKSKTSKGHVGTMSHKAMEISNALPFFVEKLLDFCENHWIDPGVLFDSMDYENSGFILVDDLMQRIRDLGVKTDNVSMPGCFYDDDDEDIYIDKWTFLQAFEDTDSARMSSVTHTSARMVQCSTNKAKYVGLVAHNNMKSVMGKFVGEYVTLFKGLKIVTTGSTGSSLQTKLGIVVGHKVASGPLGGDAEIAQLALHDEIAAIFFFRDPLFAHSHNDDIKALTRVCDQCGVPYATNSSSGHALALSIMHWGLSEWCGVGIEVSTEGGPRPIPMHKFTAEITTDLSKKSNQRNKKIDEFRTLLHRDGSGGIDIDVLAQSVRDRAKSSMLTPSLIEQKFTDRWASTGKFLVLDCLPSCFKDMEMFLGSHREILLQFRLACTNTWTAAFKDGGLGVRTNIDLLSGSCGGYQEIGAMATRKEVVGIISFQDGSPGPSYDLEACWRLCDVHQVPYATTVPMAIALMHTLCKYGLSSWYHVTEEGAVADYKAAQAEILRKLAEAERNGQSTS